MKPQLKIVFIESQNRRQVRKFLDLPFRLYRNTPQWVPPLANEAARLLDRQRNPFFRHSQAAFLLALDGDGEPVGRLAVLENRNYNAFNRSRKAFFYLFECVNDAETARGLFSAAFDWARSQDLEEIGGPKGFSAMDGMGLLVEGFERRPALGIPYNLPYYPALVESAGFEAAGEHLSGYLSRASFQLPEKVRRVAEHVQERRGLRVARFRNRGELLGVVPQLQSLYNASLGDTIGNVPLSEDEVRALADAMLWLADPSLVKIILKEDEPVGFLLAYPDISAALQRTKGRLFPLGWAHLWLELRRTKWININGAGISEKHRGLGGTALLFYELYRTIAESRYDHADLVQVGSENDRMLRELRLFGVDFYKRHRSYGRTL